jgi:pimeloyl-ACP methyl ester carboxylesterase
VGHEVYTPTLTGMGERSHLLSPEVGLATHIRDIVQMCVYEDLRDVVLVGHSYGGMVISGVADELSERMRRLVYLDAFIRDDGQSTLGSMSWARKTAETEGDGWFVPPIPPQEMGVSDPADVAWMKPRLVPVPLLTFEEPLRLKNVTVKPWARSFIRCTEHFASEARRAKAEGWDYHELKSGHDAMITVPKELAQLLLRCVLGEKRGSLRV